MMKKINITIENKLIIEKRGMNVYHHSTKGVHLIDYNRSVTVPLQSVIKNDYLYISLVCGPGKLERQNVVDMPAWMNYEFLSEGKFSAIHQDDRIILTVPAGLPEWKLKLTRPASQSKSCADRVTIRDDQSRR